MKCMLGCLCLFLLAKTSLSGRVGVEPERRVVPPNSASSLLIATGADQAWITRARNILPPRETSSTTEETTEVSTTETSPSTTEGRSSLTTTETASTTFGQDANTTTPTSSSPSLTKNASILTETSSTSGPTKVTSTQATDTPTSSASSPTEVTSAPVETAYTSEPTEVTSTQATNLTSSSSLTKTTSISTETFSTSEPTEVTSTQATNFSTPTSSSSPPTEASPQETTETNMTQATNATTTVGSSVTTPSLQTRSFRDWSNSTTSKLDTSSTATEHSTLESTKIAEDSTSFKTTTVHSVSISSSEYTTVFPTSETSVHSYQQNSTTTTESSRRTRGDKNGSFTPTLPETTPEKYTRTTSSEKDIAILAGCICGILILAASVTCVIAFLIVKRNQMKEAAAVASERSRRQRNESFSETAPFLS